MSAMPVVRTLAGLLHNYAETVPVVAVSAVEQDSRRVTAGALFLAVAGHGPGPARHGLAYAEEAIRRGAVAVAWEPVPGLGVPQLPVPSVAVEQLGRRAGEIAARFWDHPSRSLYTAGITGTDGKTSTAHLVAQSFGRLGFPCAYFGTLGYGRLDGLEDASHTTPDAIRLQALLAQQRRLGSRACAMEVSSHALDQGRAAGVEFAAAVLTNVGRDHLDYHGDLASYAEAKRRLFTWPQLPVAILNRDDPCGAQWAQSLIGPVVTVYGVGGAAPARGRYVLATELVQHAAGLRLQLRSHWGAAQIDSRLLGRFNAYNLLAALAVLLEQGAPLDDAVRALSAAHTVPGRIEVFSGPGAQAPVVVDYAHTPQALRQVLGALRAHTEGRLLCVFGCGGDRDRGKRLLMGAAAAELADAAIVTDDNPRSEAPAAIVADIVAGIPNEWRGKVTVEHDRAAAISRAVRAARAGDLVLVAGKGHEDYQIYGAQKQPFSDRAFVAGLLGAPDADAGAST